MKKSTYILSCLFMASVCLSISGEAISPGNEACFQTALVAEREVVAPTPANAPDPVPEQETLTGVQKVYSDFVKAHQRDKRGMVIGRGNVQGVAEERIAIPELKGLSWLFVDPSDADGRFSNNPQDSTRGNALTTTWPTTFAIKDTFDAVVFDYGVTQYIGDDGTGLRLGQEYYQKQIELVIERAGGATLSKSSFDAPYKFQDWLVANRPAEFLPLEAQYLPPIQAARKRQREALEKGLLDAYLALGRGGVLIIPIDGSTDGIDFVNLLSISEVDLVRQSIKNMSDSFDESPVLPELTRGMGTSYGDYYSIVKK